MEFPSILKFVLIKNTFSRGHFPCGFGRSLSDLNREMDSPARSVHFIVATGKKAKY